MTGFSTTPVSASSAGCSASAGRAPPRRSAAWPRGTRPSSDARRRPPGTGSADGAARPAGQPFGNADQQHRRDDGDDEADHIELEDAGVRVEQVADQPADDRADNAQRQGREEAHPLLAGLDQPGERTDDEADHDEAEDLHSVLLRPSGAMALPTRCRDARSRYTMDVDTPMTGADAPFPRSWSSVTRVTQRRKRVRCARGTFSSSASTVRCTSLRSARPWSRRTTRLPPVGSWVIVIVTRVPPSPEPASSIRVLHVSGVSRRRGAPSRGGPHSTISPWGAPAPGAPSSRPGAQTNVVPRPGLPGPSPRT